MVNSEQKVTISHFHPNNYFHFHPNKPLIIFLISRELQLNFDHISILVSNRILEEEDYKFNHHFECHSRFPSIKILTTLENSLIFFLLTSRILHSLSIHKESHESQSRKLNKNARKKKSEEGMKIVENRRSRRMKHYL